VEKKVTGERQGKGVKARERERDGRRPLVATSPPPAALLRTAALLQCSQKPSTQKPSRKNMEKELKEGQRVLTNDQGTTRRREKWRTYEKTRVLQRGSLEKMMNSDGGGEGFFVRKRESNAWVLSVGFGI
jgi:hypothetical protein